MEAIMADLSLTQSPNNQSPFDSIRRYCANGNEYWLARELMPLLGYAKWERFGSSTAIQASVIQRAIISAKASGTYTEQHFLYVGKLIERGNGAKVETEDCELSRYACYLIAMCGDVTKPEIAQAQSYFAIKTREAEVKKESPAIQLPPARDTIDYIRAQSYLDKRKRDRFTALAEQMLIAELAEKQNLQQRALPSTIEPAKHYTTVMIRAAQLGYSASQINGGSELGKFVKKTIEPDHKDWQGQYQVWQYEVTEELDARIHAFFLTRTL
jgi:hypothetical protein